MTAPSPLIMETLAAHQPRVYLNVIYCSCSADKADWIDYSSEHVAQALTDAGVLGPEQVREREAAVLHALADEWQWAYAPRVGNRTQELIADAQFVTDWLRAQADERGPR